jgi:putative tryptophan/tyrosine transport system substrate-binding protein
MIGRRALLASLGFLAAAPALAQARPRRIGVLRPGLRPRDDDPSIDGLVTALNALGYEVGQTLIIDHRYAEGRTERLPTLARELLQAGAEALLAVGTSAALAAREAAPATPIVMFANVDPVRLGIVDTIGRPTGNITGVLIAPDGSLAGKRLFLLKEAVPAAERFALLAPSQDAQFDVQVAETRAATAGAAVTLRVVLDRDGDYKGAFAEMVAGGTQALIVGAHQFFVRDRLPIIALAAVHRLPAIYEWPLQVKAGGLMSFGADLAERQRRVAAYLDRILKGAKPSDLPFEQPAALSTVINLRTAQAMDLKLPPALLARADEVIE